MKGLLGIVFCLNEKEEVVIEPVTYTFLCFFSRMSTLLSLFLLLWETFYDNPLNFIDLLFF